MRRSPIFACLVAGLLVAAGISHAAPSATSASAPRPAAAAPALVKATAPPVIDGVLDEPDWATGQKFDGFKTFKPDYGKEASQKTEAYITYDSENFYFAFRCFDSEPAKIKAAMSKRDNIHTRRRTLRLPFAR